MPARCDFALMYVPAEAVYAEIVEDGEEDALADSAVMEQRVIPVSPRLLYAYLSTVAMGLKGLELQENARQIHEKLAELARLWERIEDPFGKLGRHLANAQKQYEETPSAPSTGSRAAAVRASPRSADAKLVAERRDPDFRLDLPTRPSLPDPRSSRRLVESRPFGA